MKDFIELILETRGERGRGSKEGRSAIRNYDKKPHVSATKTRAKVYGSINHALKETDPGDVWTTKNADRLYVTTRHKFGKKYQQTVGGKTAKGFTPGSIPAKPEDVKGYAVRTKVRHLGKTGVSKKKKK
jgi:hypothetical protein